MSGPSMAAAASRSNNDDEQRSGVPLPANEEEWISYIEESSHVDGSSPSVVSIFRVPGNLVEVSKKIEAYVPKRVSLGPFHHGSAQLAPMEHHKLRALGRIMRRFTRQQHGRDNMDFAVDARNAIVQLQEVIKNNYDGKVKYEGEILATMLTLDGCFIVEIMRVTVFEASIYEPYDPLFDRNKLLRVERDLLTDILKLENQIPFIVLQKLLELECPRDDVTDMVCQIVLDFLLTFYPFDRHEMDDGHLLSIVKQSLLLEDEGHHLLDFFRTLVVFAPSGDAGNNSVSIDFVSAGGEDAHLLSNKWDGEHERKRKSKRSLCLCFFQLPCWLCSLVVSLFSHNGGKQESNSVPDIPRAVDLANAGIKFEKCLGGIKNIYFEPESATMYLPSIIVNDLTELAFLNLMAFELQKVFPTNYVQNYVYVMKKLMVTEEDVLLLKRAGVVINYRGTEKDVAELFNNISKGIVIDKDFGDQGFAGEVMAHRNNKCNSYRAALMNQYFSTPWKTLGVVVATLLVVLTVVQTFFSILAVYK